MPLFSARSNIPGLLPIERYNRAMQSQFSTIRVLNADDVRRNYIINKVMKAPYFWVFGSLIVLGITHLLFTFFTDKFSSKNIKVITEMKSSYPILTKETTIWKAWIGFNASHSLGLIFIGVINVYFGVYYFPVLQSDVFFFAFNIFTVAFYLWLAQKYWFKIPFIGLLLTLVCFITSYVLTCLK